MIGVTIKTPGQSDASVGDETHTTTRERFGVNADARELILVRMSRSNGARAHVWDSIDDLRGDAHYIALGVCARATTSEIKRAFAVKARELHPDKGGNAAAFAKVRKAYETLIDPKLRRTYDALQKEHKYRYIRGVTQRAPGGEDSLLDDIERLGLENVCAATQLVTLCEVCGRPSTKECFVCTALFCDFCERKQHWKGEVGLHWPVVQVDGKMAKQLGQRQLEEKRKEDYERAQREDPNYRTDSELQALRSFKEIAAEMYHPDGRHKKRYDARLAQNYMWTQSMRSVFVAVHIPTGYADKELHCEFNGDYVLVQPEDSLPVVDRVLARSTDARYPVQTFQTEDKRFLMIEMRKAKIGEEWKKLFEGDSDYARCVKPPYELKESNSEVLMEFELPFWIDSEDVGVNITPMGIRIKVGGEFDVERMFWKKPKRKEKDDEFNAIDIEECTWSLDDAFERESGDPCKVLMVLLAKPKPDEQDMQYKRGVRSDNRNVHRDDERQGVRFFIDDQDSYFLETILQAAEFVETGSAWYQPPPNVAYKPPFASTGRYIRDFEELAKDVKEIITTLLENRPASAHIEEDIFDIDDLENDSASMN